MKKKFIIYGILFSAILIFILWFIFNDFYFLIWSIVLLNLFNVVFAFGDIRERIYFLFLNLTIFLFLLSRPFIDMIYRNDNLYAYNEKTGCLALLLIGCSLLFLLIGLLLSERFLNKKRDDEVSDHKTERALFIKYIQTISLTIYFVCLACNYLIGIEKIIFSQTHTYTEYYVTYQTKLPLIIRGMSGMMPIALSIYLTTMPSKKRAMLPLVLYIISAIPNLILGSRGGISKGLIFVFLYFFLRDTLNQRKSEQDGLKREKWITKFLTRLIAITIPIIIILFSSYNYVRFGIKKTNDMNPVIDFIYNQGISFTVITRGYTEAPHLPNYENKHYTLGPLVDYITRGTPAQMLFGVKGLGSSNNVFKAIEGNNFSHALSYHLYGNNYLCGIGSGSSFIIELYIDYGFIGVSIFSVLLGVLLSSINKIIGRNWITDVMILMTLMEVFIIPRSSALGWTLTFITPQFWSLIVFCWLASKILIYRSTKNGNLK